MHSFISSLTKIGNRLTRGANRLLLSSSVLALLALPQLSWAQANPKILVLTTHEGMPEDGIPTLYRNDGLWASNGLARAFGYEATVSSTPDIDPTTPPGHLIFTTTPEVTYVYGALSIRALKASDTIHSGTEGSEKKVRVINSITPAQEVVVHMPDDTRMLTPENLDLFKPASGGERYDLVVLGSTYFKVVDEAYDTLVKLMQDPVRRPGAILFFIDSCCDSIGSHTGNMERLSSMVLAPASGQSITPSLNDIGGYSPVLNSSSPYRTSFEATASSPNLPSIVGGYFRWLDGVPSNNQLFVDANPAAQTYGAFFPSREVFRNSPAGGTCLFAVVDITPFDNSHYHNNVQNAANPGNTRNLGQAFINAALPGGSCGGMASIVASSPHAINLRDEQTITLTLSNVSNSQITGGRVVADLPANLLFGSTPVSSTCKGLNGLTLTPSSTGTQLALSGVHLANAAETCTVTVPVRWSDTSDPSTNACIRSSQHTSTLSITPGASTGNLFSTDQGQTHDQAISEITCSAPELALTAQNWPTSAITAGQTVDFALTATNLSETSSATNAQILLTLPAGSGTPSFVPATGNPANCMAPSSCTLEAGEAASFNVSFTAASATALNVQARIDLPNPASEVTLSNNEVALSADVTPVPALPIGISGSVTGGPAALPANVAAQTVGFELTCSPNAATPTTGTLQLATDNSISLSSSTPTVPTGSSCTMALTGSPQALTAPSGYQWDAPVVTGSGTTFTVTLPLTRSQTPSAPHKVPTLQAWALMLLGLLMAGMSRRKPLKRTV